MLSNWGIIKQTECQLGSRSLSFFLIKQADKTGFVYVLHFADYVISMRTYFTCMETSIDMCKDIMRTFLQCHEIEAAIITQHKN